MDALSRFDDPLENSELVWPDEAENEPGELALGVVSALFPPAAVFKVFKDRFDQRNREGRAKFFFKALVLKLRALEREVAASAARLSEIQHKTESPEYKEAIYVAAEESIRTARSQKVHEFVAVLVGSLAVNQWADPNEDIAAMIRDIAQLGEKDLKVLTILKTVHASAISTAPNLHEPDAFSRETPTLNRAISEAGFHRDDFLSICERLRGFGLAAEVLRNTSHMALHDYCYRPTRRGLAVLSYLSAATGGSTAAAAPAAAVT
jgi:hypothetical protein